MWKEPHHLGSIVAGTGEFGGGRSDFEEGINGGNGESAEDVAFGQGKEEFAYACLYAELLAHLADAAFMERFARVNEASGEVERALRGSFRTAYDEEAPRSIADDGDRGGGGIEIIGEAARATTLRAGIVWLEIGRATDGAETKKGETHWKYGEILGGMGEYWEV